MKLSGVFVTPAGINCAPSQSGHTESRNAQSSFVRSKRRGSSAAMGPSMPRRESNAALCRKVACSTVSLPLKTTGGAVWADR